MIKEILKRSVGLGVLALILAVPVLGQTGQMEGTVKIKAEDGTLKPVQGALVEIYRVDIKGKWEVKTDKSGHYVYLGLPLVGTFIVVASGPGMQPTWLNNVKISQVPTVDIVANPGDGSKMTFDQVQAQIAQMKTRGSQAGAPAATDKAKTEAAQKSQKEFEAAKKEAEALQANFEQARNHYNQGVELKKTNNLQGALSEFELAAAVDPSKHAAFAELSHKANANVAETHYQIGVDLFNQRKKQEAKPHFEAAVESIKKAISVVATDTKDPNLNNELIIYYDIQAKNARLLVEYFGAADLVDETIKAIGQAETLDAANKNKWAVMKADLYRAAFRSDEAVAAYKAVLAADPNNIDALYGIGLTLVASTEKEKLQEAANYLAEFVSKAPANHKDVPGAKGALEALKNEFKVEAEKPAKRRARP